MNYDPEDEYSPEAMRRKAERGVPSDQYQFAQIYHYGHGVPEDHAKARRWYERAAKQGYKWAQRVLGNMMVEGSGGPVDLTGGITWLREAAEQGDPHAMNELGWALRKEGTPAYQTEAFRWLEAAARRDNSRAQFQLSLMLEAEIGTDINPNAALKWLRQASLKEDAARLHLQDHERNPGYDAGADLRQALRLAEAQDPDAMFRAGRMLLDGVGQPPDEAAALKWLQQAAEHGHAGAMFYLYEALSRGSETESDDMKSWLERAAKAGYIAAQTMWGRYQRFGSPEMIHWLRQAAAQGDLNAQYHLGSLPFQLTCDVTKAEGLGWLEKAAQAGHASAQYMLGAVYEDGWAGTRDAQTALKWFHKAADQGDASAMASIGFMFYRGRTEDDARQALEWMLKGEDMGALNLTEHIAALYAGEQALEADPPLALKWYLRAARFSPDNYQWNNASKIKDLLQRYPDAAYDYNEYASFLVQAAAWGYPTAQFELGVLYRRGLGVPKDLHSAAKWLELAAQQGHSDAVQALTEMLAAGEGVEANEAEAVRILQESAERGDRQAQFALASRYLGGHGVPRDPGRAIELLQSAAKSELPEAQFELGRRMIDGDGVPRALKEGVYLVNEAARHLPEARLYLMDWLQGYPEPELAKVPFKDLLAAAESGDPAAQLELSIRYRHVQTSAVDVEAALSWVRKAAEQGHLPAQVQLASYLSEHLWLRRGVERQPDFAEAATWLQRAAAKGYVAAQIKLAEWYLQGRGLNQNTHQAIKWYESAAEQGSAEAAEALGDLHGRQGYYPNQDLPPYNRDTAVRWYLQAVQLGQKEAYVRLARLYGSPTSGERDPVEAVKWYSMALESGVRMAAWNLADHYLHGDGVPADPDRAVALLEGLFERGDEHGAGRHAMLRLGEIFERGDGVPPDAKRAIAYYTRGAEYTFSEPAFRAAALFHGGPVEVRNPAEALRWFLTAIYFWIEGGDGTEVFKGPIAEPHGNLANACLALGERLEHGAGLEKDLAEALLWYKRAAYFERKYPAVAAVGAFKVATLVEMGIDQPKDFPNGRHYEPEPPIVWYQKAAESVAGLSSLQVLFSERGDESHQLVKDVDRRLATLVPRINELAAKGVPEAQFDLARLYRLGRGLPQNDEAAWRWMSLAAGQDHLGAQSQLGLWLVSTSPDNALIHFRAATQMVLARVTPGPRYEAAVTAGAASSNYASTQQELEALSEPRPADLERPNMNVFVFSDGPEPLPATLKELKALAEQRGEHPTWPYAAFESRPFLENARNATHANDVAHWTAKAAEAGLPEAQVTLAELFEKGLGVDRDLVKAYAWYCIAAAYGEPAGQLGKSRLKDKMSPAHVEEGQKQAAAWWSARPHQ